MKSAADIWEKVKTLMENEMTSVSIETWFGDVDAVALEDTRLVLCVPTDFKRNIIRSRFQGNVERALKELFSFDVDVALLLPEERERYESAAPKTQDSNPFANYTFDRFVVGSTNKFAFIAAQKVADQPGGAYNPLFIHGQSGLGKTHLLHAISNRIHELHPDYRIMYIKSEDFVNELITNLRRGIDMQEFRDKYRKVDLFLMDDVQFIAGKDSTQEEFFHTFNKLYESGKQIVMTSDRKPSDMPTLEDRLRTRFEWGLLADISPPDYETRMAILKNKAKSLGLDLSDDVCNYIAINITNNVRQIEGTVKKIMAYHNLSNMPLDLPNITRAISDMFKNEGSALPTPSLIITQVSKFYSIDEIVLRGSKKNKGTAEARQVAMYLIRQLTNLSLPDIGREFNRDHSTVLHSIRKVEMELKNGNQTLQDNIRDITANINSCL